LAGTRQQSEYNDYGYGDAPAYLDTMEDHERPIFPRAICLYSLFLVLLL